MRRSGEVEEGVRQTVDNFAGGERIMLAIMWVYIVFSVLVGLFASKKKRSGVRWFLLSLVITPLIAFIIILATQKEG